MQLNNSARHRVREEICTIKRQGVAQRDQHIYCTDPQLPPARTEKEMFGDERMRLLNSGSSERDD